jgi:hypothetical protein
VLRLWDGISVYATEQQSRAKARQFPLLGRYLARLEIPAGLAVWIERTTRSEGHHTLWASGAALRSCVVGVVPA